MKRLGTPPHSVRFFEGLVAGLGDRIVASWATVGDRTVAVLLGGIAGTCMHVVVTASDPAFWRLHPNDLCHWELLQWAVSQNLKIADLGSARKDSELQYKKKWGAELLEYCNYQLFRNRTPVLHLSESPRLRKVWRGCVPLKATRLLGPLIKPYRP
jgi:CelD/BcsL family acetyltransferase involved in cellulose biosynthesis